MKIGDKIRHKRRQGIATIVNTEVEVTYDDFKDRKIVKTTYIARYEDGRLLMFHGYHINKTVFKVDEFEQLSFFDNNKFKLKGD